MVNCQWLMPSDGCEIIENGKCWKWEVGRQKENEVLGIGY